MISEERLKTLIEQEKIVYDPDTVWGEVGELKLNKTMKVIDGKVCGDIKEGLPNSCSISCFVPLIDLFETRTDAEEYLKYGNVTRTEKLELPMWKDVEELINENGFAKYNLVINEYFECFFEIFGKYKKIRILNSKNAKALFFEELTRENYDKARDIAIRLWKGEEV